MVLQSNAYQCFKPFGKRERIVRVPRISCHFYSIAPLPERVIVMLQWCYYGVALFFSGLDTAL
jgi:hypothetical protein